MYECKSVETLLECANLGNVPHYSQCLFNNVGFFYYFFCCPELKSIYIDIDF